MRDDGSVLAMPTYDCRLGLPPDLANYIVEREPALAWGSWALVAAGAPFTLMIDGKVYNLTAEQFSYFPHTSICPLIVLTHSRAQLPNSTRRSRSASGKL